MLTTGPIRKLVAVFLVFTTLLVSGCGYLLYPERKGQTGGRLDAAVVLLDAAGLLFYLVPGLIAFAVDLTNGTIFLPPGGRSALDKHVGVALPEDPEAAGWREVPVAGEINDASVAAALSRALGVPVAATDLRRLDQDARWASL